MSLSKKPVPTNTVVPKYEDFKKTIKKNSSLLVEFDLRDFLGFKMKIHHEFVLYQDLGLDSTPSWNHDKKKNCY